MIGRLLGQLVTSAEPGELDIIVVANGCSDDTVEIASGFGAPVRVLTMAAASKPAALAAGDQAATTFPRVYVDADVALRAEDLRALGEALQSNGFLAVGPVREFDMTGRPWAVRWYYDIWTRLPEVQRGLFGRGVIAFSAAGHSRVTGLQPVLADDLAVSLAFASNERRRSISGAGANPAAAEACRLAAAAGPSCGRYRAARTANARLRILTQPERSHPICWH